MKKIVAAVVLSTLLTGCVTKYFQSYPSVSSYSDPIQYAEAYIGYDNPVVVNLSGDGLPVLWHETLDAPQGTYVVEKDGVKYYEKCWHSMFYFNGYDRFKDKDKFIWITDGYKKICKSMGGSYDKTLGWCSKDYQPIFRAITSPSWRKSKSSNNYCTEIAQPSSGTSINNKDWIAFAENNFFLSKDKIARIQADAKKQRAERLKREQAEQKQREEKLRQEQKRLRQAEAARQQKETPVILRTRGLHICKRLNGFNDYPYLSGYVEDASGSRVKILVSERITSPGWQDANFRQQTIWDKANNWYICE